MADEPQYGSLEQALHSSTFATALQTMLRAEKGTDGNPLYAEHRPDGSALRIYGIVGEFSREGLQKWAGAEPDGKIGPKTIAALNAKLKQLGLLDQSVPVNDEAALVKALNKKLHDGGFYGAPDNHAELPAAPQLPQSMPQPPLIPSGPSQLSPNGNRPSLKGQEVPLGTGNAAGTLVYHVESGQLMNPATGETVALCVSGLDKGRNNPLYEDKRNYGSIPANVTYSVGRIEPWSQHPKLNGDAIPLTDPKHSYGRGGIFLHQAGYIEDEGCIATHGCIGVLPQSPRNVDQVNEYILSHKITGIRVVSDTGVTPAMRTKGPAAFAGV